MIRKVAGHWRRMCSTCSWKTVQDRKELRAANPSRLFHNAADDWQTTVIARSAAMSLHCPELLI